MRKRARGRKLRREKKRTGTNSPGGFACYLSVNILFSLYTLARSRYSVESLCRVVKCKIALRAREILFTLGRKSSLGVYTYILVRERGRGTTFFLPHVGRASRGL